MKAEVELGSPMTSSAEMPWGEFANNFKNLNYSLQKITSRAALETELVPFNGRVVRNISLPLLNKLVPNLDLRSTKSKFSVLFGLKMVDEASNSIELDVRQFFYSYAINKNPADEFVQDKINFAFRIFDENDDGE